MRKKHLKPLIICLCVLAVIGLLYVIPKLTPEGAIRAYLFWENPPQSLSCTLIKEKCIDPVYRQQYSVCNFQGRFDGVYFAYVKRNPIGLYDWTNGGSGP